MHIYIYNIYIYVYISKIKIRNLLRKFENFSNFHLRRNKDVSRIQ